MTLMTQQRYDFNNTTFAYEQVFQWEVRKKKH
uniref:Uncharacterized protein n=1 Tax=Rhizophora mucronata TaxID=61149 RepID=A0A2P2QFS8_RHIMU